MLTLDEAKTEHRQLSEARANLEAISKEHTDFARDIFGTAEGDSRSA